MYDSTIGRWINLDPIGFEGGDANPNRYVGNGPTNATDPTGLVGDKITSQEEFVKDYVAPRQLEISKDPTRFRTEVANDGIAGITADVSSRHLARLLGELTKRSQEKGGGILILVVHGHLLGSSGAIRFGGNGTDEQPEQGPVEDLKPDVLTRPDLLKSLLTSKDWQINALTKRNAYAIGVLLKPFLAEGALIILNGCCTGLPKSAADSIAAELARGSSATVATAMGFTTGNLTDSRARIAARDEHGMTFAEGAGWGYLRREMVKSQLDPAEEAQPSVEDRDKRLNSLQNDPREASMKILDGYKKLMGSFYESREKEVRVFEP